ncbi:hypothetical protein IV468_11055 [Enterococcus casseliflavus]|uniref:hypothetical protein n=1 Tax=Enterococcus casseliflavus TaxID=37734 RepID=UPI001E4FE70F|nr:hypothetical protein [Enterococcus casseliflavus]MCD5202327.1 hypothetical protein [Enterococcus casseliflavus]
MKISKKIVWSSVASILVPILISLAVFVSPSNKPGIVVSNDFGKITVPLRISRIYLTQTNTVFYQPEIRSAKTVLEEVNLLGESTLSIKIGEEEKEIVSYIDANVKNFSLELNVEDYDKTTGKLVLTIAYRDGLNDEFKNVTFER